MPNFKKYSVIIPAYNEVGTIEEILRRVKAISVETLEQEVIVIDDGSTDGTRELLKKQQGIEVIFHEKNLGKGGAITTGIQAASGEVLIIQDADLEYDPQDYPRLLEPILEGGCNLVMGSRFLHERPRFFTKDGDPMFSHFIANILIIWLTNFLYGCRFTDYEGCYKSFTKELAEEVSVGTNGFDFDNELICKTLRRGYPIKEVPIHYKPRLYAEGKKIGLKDAIAIFWAILKWRFISI